MARDVLKELLGFRSELFGFIRAILRNTHDAEDVFQEVCRIVLEKAKDESPFHDFRAWVKEIARRQVLRHYRIASARRACLPTPEMVELVSDTYVRYSPPSSEVSEEYEALRECMGKMAERHLRLLRLRYALDQSYDSIARYIRRSEGAVRRMVSRLRALLADCVRQRLGTLELKG